MKKLILLVTMVLTGIVMVNAQNIYRVDYVETADTNSKGKLLTEVSIEIDLSSIPDQTPVDIRAGKKPGDMRYYYFEMVKDTNLFQIPGITRIEGTEKAIIDMGRFVVKPDSFYVEVNWYATEE